MKRFVLGTSSFLGVLATLATVSMMLAITFDVVVRGITGASMPGVFELSETVLVAAVFLGMAYTGATNGHIAVDLVTERLPRSVSRWVITFAWAATAGILTWMIYATGMRAIASTESNEARMGLVNWPVWPSRWLIVIGLVAMLLIAIANVVRVASGKEVLGYQEFDIEVTDTTTLQTAMDEREDISALAAANEPVGRADTDASEKTGKKEQSDG